MSSEDRAALVALFRSTGGTRWKQKTSWDTDADLSQWYGVQVNEHGRVVEVGLYHNNLEGTIPVALGALTELGALYLQGNKLTGPIPQALGELTELTYLWLDVNKLTGSIPTSLGSLSKLRGLHLSDNQLVGPIPEALGALKELALLYLDGNKLTGPIPEALGALKELNTLYLYGNELTGDTGWQHESMVHSADVSLPCPRTRHWQHTRLDSTITTCCVITSYLWWRNIVLVPSLHSDICRQLTAALAARQPVGRFERMSEMDCRTRLVPQRPWQNMDYGHTTVTFHVCHQSLCAGMLGVVWKVFMPRLTQDRCR